MEKTKEEIIYHQIARRDMEREIYAECDKEDLDREKLKENGLRPALIFEKATHAICRHGIIAMIDADDHRCTWKKLVRIEEEEV